MSKTLAGLENFIDRAFDILVTLVLIVGIYYAVDSVLMFKDSDASKVAAFKPTAEDPGAYLRLSENCVAWLALYDTGIDYPIMQGKDNNEYLNKDPYGAYAMSGSVFLDSRNNSDFADDYSLVYGHHMEGKYMFGALDNFSVQEFFDTHRSGEIVINKKFHKIETFAFTHTDASEGVVFNPEIVADRKLWIRENAEIYTEPKEGARIIALTTCQTPASTTRTILFVQILD